MGWVTGTLIACYVISFLVQRVIETRIEINAPATEVWNLLCDFSSYVDWNPYIFEAKGDASVDSLLSIRFRNGGATDVSMTVKVIRIKEQYEIVWRNGGMTLPAVYAEHYFRIEQRAADTLEFVHGESFRGPMGWLISTVAGTSTRECFNAMNTALKLRAENSTNQ